MPNVFNRILGGSGSGESADFLIQGLSHSVLPSGYTEYDSITSDGQAYINTQYCPKTNTTAKFWFSFATTSNAIRISATRNQAGHEDNAFWFAVVSGEEFNTYIYNYVSEKSDSSIIKPNTRLEVESLANGQVYLNGSLVPHYSGTWTSGNITQPLYLFGLNNAGNYVANGTAVTIGQYELYEGSTKVHHYIPCKNSNQEVGMLDIVPQVPVFYGNSGSGTFTVGNEVKTSTVTATKGAKSRQGTWQTIQVPNPAYHNLPSGFTEVESIINGNSRSSNGCIDTGIIPTNTYTVEVGCKIGSRYGSQDYTQLFSAGSTYKVGNFTVSVKDDRTGIATAFGAYDDGYATFSKLNTDIIVKLNQNGLYVDSDLMKSPSSQTFTSNTELFLLKDVRYSNIYCYNTELQYCKIWSDLDCTTLVAELIPCLNNDTGKYGMYDVKNRVFRANSGSADFSAGAIVPATLSASGYYVPNIDEYGTWTVVATDGTHTATHDVLVDFCMTYQFEMSYLYYLYDEGNEWVSRSGGWSSFTCSSYITETLTKSSSALQNYSSRNSGSYNSSVTNLEAYNFYGYCSTNNKVDLTDFSTLRMKLSVTSWNSQSTSAIYIFSTKTTDTSFNPTVIQYYGEGTGDYDLTIDISSYSGEYYIAQANRVRYSGHYVTCLVKQVWLE